jgi:hypothetical protein
VATHLPLVVKDEGPHGLLEGHFARANRHWQALAGRETLAVFAGPHSYVSPTLYVDPLSVPTWNYIAVHAYGTLELVEDEAGKEALLAGLIRAHEPAFAEKWRRMPGRFPPLDAGRDRRLPHPHRAHRRQVQDQPEPRPRSRAPQRPRRPRRWARRPDQQALAAWMKRLV